MPSVITSHRNPQENIYYSNTGSTEASCSANKEEFSNFNFTYWIKSPLNLSGRINVVFDKSSEPPIINGDKKTFDSVQLFTDEELFSYIVDIDNFKTIPLRKRFSIEVEIIKVSKRKPVKLNLEDF